MVRDTLAHLWGTVSGSRRRVEEAEAKRQAEAIVHSLPSMPKPVGRLTRDNVPRMLAPGYNIAPFVPELEWIRSTIPMFYAGEKRLKSGRCSFSNELYGIYYGMVYCFNYGLPLGRFLESLAQDLEWQVSIEVIDGIEITSCIVDDHIDFSEKVVQVQGQQVRIACAEPWLSVNSLKGQSRVGGDNYNFYYAWLGKAEALKGIYNHDARSWIS